LTALAFSKKVFRGMRGTPVRSNMQEASEKKPMMKRALRERDFRWR
jgi:hypothetical protein